MATCCVCTWRCWVKTASVENLLRVLVCLRILIRDVNLLKQFIEQDGAGIVSQVWQYVLYTCCFVTCNTCHVTSAKRFKSLIIICPIAIAYSMGQIIKWFCVCQCVSVSVCEHSHGRISWSIFTKIGTDVKTPKRKKEFVMGQYHTTPSLLCPTKPPF